MQYPIQERDESVVPTLQTGHLDHHEKKRICPRAHHDKVSNEVKW